MTISKKKLFLLIGGILAITAFLFSFFVNVHYDYKTLIGQTTVYYKGAVWGATQMDILNSGWVDMSKAANPAVLTLVGYILVLASGIALTVLALVDINAIKDYKKIIVLSLAGVLLLGIIFVYCVAASFKGSNPDLVSTENIVYEFGNWASCTSGTLGIAGVALTVVSQFVKVR